MSLTHAHARARRFLCLARTGCFSGASPPITTSTHARDSTATNRRRPKGPRGAVGRGPWFSFRFAREVVIALWRLLVGDDDDDVNDDDDAHTATRDDVDAGRDE